MKNQYVWGGRNYLPMVGVLAFLLGMVAIYIGILAFGLNFVSWVITGGYGLASLMMLVGFAWPRKVSNYRMRRDD